MKDIEKQMKALANRRRLVILKYLKKSRESTVGSISEEIKLSFKSTSRHLGVLYAAGILEKEQRNVEVYYRLSAQLHPTTKAVLLLL